MVSRAERLRQNAEKSKFKINNSNDKKQTENSKNERGNGRGNGRGKSNHKDKDEMDKKIDYINSLHNLDKITVKDITKFEGDWSYFVAEYFKEKLNINQLRDIHQLFKSIEQKLSMNECWNDIKLDYNLLKLNINLKYERNTIPKKFYQLIYSFIKIIDNLEENKKIENLNKIIILIDSMVGYHKYISLNLKEDKSLTEILLKINSQYLLNIGNNDDYVSDTKKISNYLNTNSEVPIYQLRKIFNVYRLWENKLNNNWTNIEEEYYKFYPKLAYMAGRGLISNEFFKLLIYCMDVIDTADNKEKILKFKNFIKYYEAIISYYTYQNVKTEMKKTKSY